MTTPAAGWYQDPQNASMKRYWDAKFGSGWLRLSWLELSRQTVILHFARPQ